MKIPFYKIQLPEICEIEILKTLRTGWLTNGPKSIELEEYFQRIIGRKHALATNCATAALHLAIKSLGLKKGDQVVVPTMTFTATANAVLYSDLDVIFCDVNEKTYNIDPDFLENLLKEDFSKKIKAVVVVHVAGLPVEMDKILNLKKKFGFFLIEDAAHCLPGKWNSRPLGSYGDVSVFSFNPTKNIPGADGGMVLVDEVEQYKKMKIWRTSGIDRDAWKRSNDHERGWDYDVVDLGYKYNASDLSSTLVLSQMAFLDEIYRRKLEIVQRYNEGLGKIKNVDLPIFKLSSGEESAWHLYIIQVPERDKLYQYLLKKGIQTLVHYKPLHMHSYWESYSDNVKLGNAEKVYGKILSLPLYHTLKDEEVDFIILEIDQFYNQLK